jgi:hypothetical protein
VCSFCAAVAAAIGSAQWCSVLAAQFTAFQSAEHSTERYSQCTAIWIAQFAAIVCVVVATIDSTVNYTKCAAFVSAQLATIGSSPAMPTVEIAFRATLVAAERSSEQSAELPTFDAAIRNSVDATKCATIDAIIFAT